MKFKNILIYSGPGALKEGIAHLKLTLTNALKTSHNIQLIGPKELIETNWENKASLFILPGGADLPYGRRLNGIGNAKIKSYVENGGSFLGICAGSYYAGSFVEFALNSPIEVKGMRELGFFPGTVKGPVCKEFHYSSHKGSEAISLLWSQNEPFLENSYFKVYYNGGGYFVDAEKALNTTILARYNLSEKLPALIECKVGKGIAILSGTHFEYDHSLFNSSDPFLKDITLCLKQNQQKRLELNSHIFERLGVH